MDLIKNKNFLIATAIVLIIIIVLLLPIKYPYKIKAQGKIVPAQEWILHKQTDGSLLTVFRDNLQNSVQTFTAYQVERGDILKFQLSKSLKAIDYITQGDTIGFIYSNEIDREIERLKGELGMAQASLHMNLAGEKTSLIQEAKNRSALNKARADLQNKIVERQAELFKNELISQESLEISQSTAKIYELEAAMAEAQLQTMQTGAKTEQIQLIESEIQAKNDELKILQERNQSFMLRSPLDGNLLSMVSEDTLLIVADKKSVVIIPINWQYFSEVADGQHVTIDYERAGKGIAGKVAKVNRVMQTLRGEQVFVATALLNSDSVDLPRNLIIPCEINGKARSALEHLSRFIKTLFM
jgi:hypothetical protein